jgi:hypothetical protein
MSSDIGTILILGLKLRLILIGKIKSILILVLLIFLGLYLSAFRIMLSFIFYPAVMSTVSN